MDEAKLQTALDDYSKLFVIRDAYTRALEDKVVAGDFKKSQETGAKISLPDSYKDVVELLGAKTLEELFVCSDSEIEYGASEVSVEIVPAKGEKCPRCWNYRELDENGVCERCGKVLDDLNFKYED